MTGQKVLQFPTANRRTTPNDPYVTKHVAGLGEMILPLSMMTDCDIKRGDYLLTVPGWNSIWIPSEMPDLYTAAAA